MRHGQRSGTTQSGGRSTLSRVFGVGFRRETYANLVYLLARFPLGIAYFTTFVTGLSLGFALIPVIVGIPILAGVLALAGYVGVIEAEILTRLCGRKVSYDTPDPGEVSMVAYLKTVATTPRNYLLVLFALGSFVVGLSLFVSIVVAFSIGLALAVTPFVYWLPGAEYNLTRVTIIERGNVSIDVGSVFGASINTLPEAVAVSLVGIGICLVGLHAVNLTARVLGAVTERLLGGHRGVNP